MIQQSYLNNWALTPIYKFLFLYLILLHFLFLFHHRHCRCRCRSSFIVVAFSTHSHSLLYLQSLPILSCPLFLSRQFNQFFIRSKFFSHSLPFLLRFFSPSTDSHCALSKDRSITNKRRREEKIGNEILWMTCSQQKIKRRLYRSMISNFFVKKAPTSTSTSHMFSVWLLSQLSFMSKLI